MTISAERIQRMVTHWLSTPVNAYLGSTYGADIDSLLFSGLSSRAADDFLAKLRADIPLIAQLPPQLVNIYADQQPPDKLTIGIEVAGAFVSIDRGGRVVSQA
jgi:hypothetical protein